MRQPKLEKRILIVRTDRIGDVVLTLPMVSAIKEQLPNAKVIFMASSYTEPLARLADGINEVVLYDPNWSLARRIRAFKDTHANFVFFPSPKPGLAIAAYLAGLTNRVGTGFRWYSVFFNHWIRDHRSTANYNEADYNIRMLPGIGLRTPPTRLPTLRISNELRDKAEQILASAFGERPERFAVLHIGTGGSSINWAAEQFVALSGELAQLYHLPILLTGTPPENEMLLRLSAEMKAIGANVQVVTGVALPELAAVLAKADLVVAGSTGPGHLAAALGAPTIGLFPRLRVLSKERWGFRGKRVLNLTASQAPKVSCPDCKTCICMEKMSVAEIVKAASELLASD
ncbi:MAG: glycosyltransferase family 9 protein [Candidatus Kapaibacterium sp.]